MVVMLPLVCAVQRVNFRSTIHTASTRMQCRAQQRLCNCRRINVDSHRTFGSQASPPKISNGWSSIEAESCKYALGHWDEFGSSKMKSGKPQEFQRPFLSYRYYCSQYKGTLQVLVSRLWIPSIYVSYVLNHEYCKARSNDPWAECSMMRLCTIPRIPYTAVSSSEQVPGMHRTLRSLFLQ